MKRTLFLLLFLLTSGGTFAQQGQQTLGLETGIISREGSMDFLSGSGGIFYRYNFSRKWGIQAATVYRQQYWEGPCSICPGVELMDGWFPARTRSQYFEVPVNVAININRNVNAAWKTDLLMGYTFSRLFSLRQKADFLGQKLEGKPYYYGPLSSHYFNLGIDVKHIFNEKYVLALNPGFRLAPFWNSNPPAYLHFLVRFGRIL